MTDATGTETLRRIATMPRFNWWLADLIRPHLGARTVEVGCGLGTMTELLLPGMDAMLCLDIEAEHVTAVRALFPDDARLRVIKADIADQDWLKEEAGRWDSVICVNVLEHIADDVQALKNMRSLLAPGGRLILYVPALPRLYGSLDANLSHYRRYDRRVLLSQLSELGFLPSVTHYVNLFGIFGWWLNGKVLRRTLLPSGQLRYYNRLAGAFRFMEELLGPPIGLSLFLVLRNTRGEQR